MPLAKSIPVLPPGEDFGLRVTLTDMLENPAVVIERIVQTALVSPFPHRQQAVHLNLFLASGMDPREPQRKPFVMPTMLKEAGAQALVDTNLAGTPFARFFATTASKRKAR